MPGSATLYLEQAVLGHTLAFQTFAAPGAVYVALCTSAPTAAVRGIEVSGGAYTRQQGAFALLASPPNVAANAATIEWQPATTVWGDIGWFEIWDAATSGNRLYWGPLVDPVDGITPITRSVVVGDILRFSAGVLQVQAI